MNNTCFFHRLLIDLYYLPFRIISCFFYFLRVKKKIVFNNFNGRGFGENPQYIAQEIIRQGLDFDLVWLVSDLKVSMPCGIRKVKSESFKAAYELATAKVIINNVKNYLPFIKKKEQYYIQTWHGELPFKYIEGECVEKLDKRYVKESIAESKITDLLLSGCGMDSNLYRKAFWYSGEIMEKGIPKYDMLFNSSKERTDVLRQKLNISDQYKVALYAPTFRDDDNYDAYDLDVNALLKCLEEKTGSKWVMIIRMHPNANEFASRYHYGKRIINGSLVTDPQELVLVSDLLVTDYSSFMVDFMITSKPIVLYASDLEHYEKTRGLRAFYYELPFVRAKTNDELIEAINKLDLEKYEKNSKRFVKERIKNYDDGYASKHVVERIRIIMDHE